MTTITNTTKKKGKGKEDIKDQGFTTLLIPRSSFKLSRGNIITIVNFVSNPYPPNISEGFSHGKENFEK